MAKDKGVVFSEDAAKRTKKVVQHVEGEVQRTPTERRAARPATFVRYFLRGILTGNLSAGGSQTINILSDGSTTGETATVYLEFSGSPSIASGVYVYAFLEYSSGKYFVTKAFNC